MPLTSIIQLMRPHQWLKNTFVFLPVFFSGNIDDVASLYNSVVAFIAFCMASSAVYCLNDIRDAEADRSHPRKRLRPVASGAIKPWQAVVLLIILVGVSLLSTCLLPPAYRMYTMAILLVYIVINIAYCIKLKHLTLVDVFVISVGFVLRVVAGGAATGIYISHWIVLMTFLLSLFLALSKRRDDVIIFQTTGVKPRRNIHRYNLDFMSQATTLVSTVTLVCYIMYTVSAEVIERMQSHMVYLTSIFVLAGLLRYIQLTVVDSNSGSPTRVLIHDRFIHCCIVGWIAAFIAIIYF